MYVVTFYSFKGGVGRSMSLANVATELANRGKKVLMVDFDLEAPGLHTFDFGLKKTPESGVVEYVESYLQSNESPDVTKHIYDCNLNTSNEGKLWLMPSGKLDDTYSTRLSRLDWNDLYENRSGYLFFEDLKAQWKAKYNPDYVLIDSRTGHTDVGGICTRQLPNSIVFLFFPNEQNLTGLKKVVSAVENQNTINSDSQSQIEMHFVSSNVPDLDDENQILCDTLSDFSKSLNYDKLTAELHRYNSLALLNQQIFTLHRPRTQLAQEYRKLTNEIILKNDEDIEGASSYLQTLIKSKSPDGHKITEDRLRSIQEKHKNNPSILNLLSQIIERYGDVEESLSLVNRAIEFGDTKAVTKLRQARLLHALNINNEALNSISSALNSTDLKYTNVRLAVNLVVRINPASLELIVNSPAFQSLESNELIDLVNKYFTSEYSRLDLAIHALLFLIETKEQLVDANQTKIVNEIKYAKLHLSLIYLAKGEFEKSIEFMGSKRPDINDQISTIFNYAMAEWGATNKAPQDLIQLVLNSINEDVFNLPDTNFKQCIALSYWAIGDSPKALELAYNIKESLLATTSTFSCWTYLNSSSKEFINDIDEMISGIKSNNVIPQFISRGKDLF